MWEKLKKEEWFRWILAGSAVILITILLWLLILLIVAMPLLGIIIFAAPVVFLSIVFIKVSLIDYFIGN